MREGHSVETLQIFVEKRWRDVRTAGARLMWELNHRRRSLQAEVAGLVAQLVRAAHQSQVICDLSSRVAKILEETDKTATIEGVLMAATLMGSLEHEVRKTVSKEAAPTRNRLLRCKSSNEAPKQRVVAATPRPNSISVADWREVPLEETAGYGGFQRSTSQTFVGVREAEAVEANTRPEEAESEAGHNDARFQRLSSEESDGGVLEDPTSPEVEWPVVCKVMMVDGRQGRLRWEDGRVHAYAFTHEDRPSHLLLQVLRVHIFLCPSLHLSLSLSPFCTCGLKLNPFRTSGLEMSQHWSTCLTFPHFPLCSLCSCRS